MRKLLVTSFALLCFSYLHAAAQVDVHVEPAHLDGPRELAPQTEQGVIRDYLESWKTMRTALNENNAGLLGKDFVGDAKDKLTDTVHQQASAGIHTLYQDRSHNLQIVFYSPEGLSIQLKDAVDYDVLVFDKNKQISSQHVHLQYVVVMTPAEVRWRVRVLQPQSE